MSSSSIQFQRRYRTFCLQVILMGCILDAGIGVSEAAIDTTSAAKAQGLNELRISDDVTLPLPPGQWQVVQKEDVKLCNHIFQRQCRLFADGRAFVLVNKDSNNPVAGLVFRHSYRSVPKQWGNHWCYRRSAPLGDQFDTLPSQRDNICTDALNTSGLNSDTTWTVIEEGLSQISDDINSLQLLDTLVHRLNSRYFRVQVFLRRRTSDLTGVLHDDLIKGWNRAYMSAVAESLLNNRQVSNISDFALKYAPVNKKDFEFEGAVGSASAPKDSPEEQRIKELKATLEIVRDIQGDQSDLYKQLSAELKTAESRLVLNGGTDADAESERVEKARIAEAKRLEQAQKLAQQQEREEQLRLAQLAKEAEETRQREEMARAEEAARLEQAQKLAQQQEREEQLRLAQLAKEAEETRRREEMARAEEAAIELAKRQEKLEKVQSIEDQLKRLQMALAALKSQQTNSTATAVGRPSTAKSRHALVIGNADYKRVGALNNSVKDAEAFADVLKDLGFTVSLHRDLASLQFKQAVSDFKNLIPPGAEIVFYYAGHGVQFGVENYLLPIDVAAQNVQTVTDYSMGLPQILQSLGEKNLKFTLAVVDACRDNPFRAMGEQHATRGVKVTKEQEQVISARGIVPTNTAAVGQMVIYSASAGQQALDNLGPADPDPNGLFTRVFLKQMREPGVTIDRIVRQVKKEVVRLAKSVNHDQVPALYDQTVGEFYFTQE
jgi:chemotaxis protein histidine kinase CheA